MNNPVIAKAITELAEYPQWVVWRYEQRKGEEKPTKTPYRADGKGRASTTDAKTWASYETASTARDYDGIGFVFTTNDDKLGTDLDHCRDKDTGVIEPWAKDIIRLLNSYTEITPSGTGVHIISKAKLPPSGNKKTGMGDNRKGDIEMYDRGRYFTITGNHLEGTPETIEERQAEIEQLHAKTFPKVESKPATAPQTVTIDDAELIKKAMAANNGAAFTALWNGDITGYGSHSEADLALCSILAFWTGKDPARIASLFKQSGQYREKWERANYRETTIKKACDNGNSYTYGNLG